MANLSTLSGKGRRPTDKLGGRAVKPYSSSRNLLPSPIGRLGRRKTPLIATLQAIGSKKRS